MLSLIKKDFKLTFNKSTVKMLIFLVVILLLTSRTSSLNFQLINLTAIIGTCMAIMPFAYDDRYNFYTTLGSLPVTKKEIVFAKYLGFIIITALLLVTSGILYTLASVFGVPTTFTLKTTLLVIFFQLSTMCCILYPIYFLLPYRVAKIFFVLTYLAFFIGNAILYSDKLAVNRWDQISAAKAPIVILLCLVGLACSAFISLFMYSKRNNRSS